MAGPFGAYLRTLRESNGLSLREAAKQAGLSSGYLSQIEGGKRGKRKGGEHFAPHPVILRRLAEVYHTRPQELFERAGFFEDQKDNYRGFSEEREVDRCFDFLIHDPSLKEVLTTPDKRAVIERYEQLTGRKLITWGGDYSHAAKKSDFKGLRLEDGVLYAESDHTLTLEDVRRELGVPVDAVKKLIRDGHLTLVRGSANMIEKREVREFKFILMQDELRRLIHPEEEPLSVAARRHLTRGSTRKPLP